MRLRVAGRAVEARLLILDKDGTLIAFGRLWHAWLEATWRALEGLVPLTAEARQALAESLGFDLTTRAWDPLGALTLAATSEVTAIIASQLYRYLRLTWPEAVDAVSRANAQAYAELPMEELVEPIGDVAGLLDRARRAGLLQALATPDDRAPTEDTLRRLGWLERFDLVLCGDDGLPHKPAPDMVEAICRRLSVAPAEAVVVGDTLGDLQMARRAGAGLAVAVTSGALDADTLAPYADVVLASVHDIEVLEETRDA